MPIVITDTTENVDWFEAAAIFEKAPLGVREPGKLGQAFEVSAMVRFAWDGNRLAGMVRAVSDRVYQAAVYDMCLLPEYQGRGVGRMLMESLMAECEGLTVVLYAVPAKVGFYRKFGFERLKTGMARFSDPVKMRAGGYIEDLD